MLDNLEIEKLIRGASVVELKAKIKKQNEILEVAKDERARLNAQLAKMDKDFKTGQISVYMLEQLVDILEEKENE